LSRVTFSARVWEQVPPIGSWAGKPRVAGTGAGARLNIAPDLLFTLRGVDPSELIINAGADLPMTRTGIATECILADRSALTARMEPLA
jgi:hypothetical protein